MFNQTLSENTMPDHLREQYDLEQYSGSSRFWLRHLLPALIFALLMLLAYPHTHLDIRIADLFFDRQLQQFTLKNAPFLAGWMHMGMKWLIEAVALSCLGLLLLSYRFASLKAYRQSFLWVFVGMAASTAAVSILKHNSLHGCPWDVALYGGHLPLFGLFETPPLMAKAGHCFPAGHPSAGFALMAFYFAFRHIKPHFSSFMLWAGLLIGLWMGAVQMMRGAHFLSHVLWSGWVVWMVLLALYWLWPLAGSGQNKTQSASLGLLMLRE